MQKLISATKPRNKCALCKYWDGERPLPPICGYFYIEKESKGTCTFGNSEYKYQSCNAFNECEFFKLYTEYRNSSVARKREPIKTLHIPKEIEALNERILGDFKSLEEITVDENNKRFCVIDGVLYTKDKKTLVLYPSARKNKTLHLPEEVESSFTDSIKFGTEIDVLDVGRNSVVDVNAAPLCYCDIKAYSADEDNEYYCAKDGVLYSKDMSTLLAYPNGKEDYSFEIPEEVEKVEFDVDFGKNPYLCELSIYPNCEIDITDIISSSNIETINILR